MRTVYWSILVALAVLVLGLFFGVTGLLLAPLVGGVVLVAIFFWLAERKAENERPVE